MDTKHREKPTHEERALVEAFRRDPIYIRTRRKLEEKPNTKEDDDVRRHTRTPISGNGGELG
jgi:hypothetical protein